MIAKDSLEVLIAAIYAAHSDGVKKVTVDIDDLVKMSEHIKDLDGELKFIEDKLRKCHISLARAEIASLDKPISLDTFA